LNTFGEKNSSWIQRTRRGKWREALGDPFASNLEDFPWLNLQISMSFERGRRRERRWSTRFGQDESWWIIEEREERGVKERIFSLLAPRVEVRCHRSDRWRAPFRPVSPYRFFQPSLGRTDDFEKFNRETLSVEPTYPRKFQSFSSILRFFSLNLLQIFYETLCIHLGHKKTMMWLHGHHQSDRW
jgi:hypothetical protein